MQICLINKLLTGLHHTTVVKYHPKGCKAVRMLPSLDAHLGIQDEQDL